MPASIIQDEAEVIRWIAEGRTYAWMAQEYERKYNLRPVPTTFSNFRHRRGLSRRIQRDDNLIPWAVKAQHRHAYDVALLRMAARKRAGAELTTTDESRLTSWLRKLDAADLVLHYDPDTEQGFYYVPRRPGLDLDLIREPDQKTTTRRRAH